MARSINYNQLVGDVEDIEMLLEDEDIPKAGIKKIKPKKKRFDDGTSVKDNPEKRDKNFKNKKK